MNAAYGLPPELATRFDWIIARYIRWCALHAAGGGWMSDYDVLNKTFTPQIADQYETNGTLHINDGEPAYVFFATQEHCANTIKKFIQEPLIDGNQMLPESHILGVTSALYPILPLIHHAKSENDFPRSGVMKNIFQG